jgi:hypothetical protein
MLRELMEQSQGVTHAFFAPVNRATETATVFDPSGGFDVENPPLGWLRLGRVRNFTRTAKLTMGTLRAGVTGTAQAQYRKQVDARVSLDFCEWGKVQMALAAGSQHMNVLESAGTAARASGGVAKTAVALATGSTATLLVVNPTVVNNYQVGELVVVDVDYAAGMTELGTGITGGVPLSGATLDVDAVRRVSFNVGVVSAVSAAGLQLDAALAGGAPASGAKVQKVVGYVDREGASFLQEWSAVFAAEAVGGGQILYYYPRLQAGGAAAETEAKLAEGLNMTTVHAEFAALAVADANDGEMVVCYRTYVPVSGAPAY